MSNRLNIKCLIGSALFSVQACLPSNKEIYEKYLYHTKINHNLQPYKNTCHYLPRPLEMSANMVYSRGRQQVFLFCFLGGNSREVVAFGRDDQTAGRHVKKGQHSQRRCGFLLNILTPVLWTCHVKIKSCSSLEDYFFLCAVNKSRTELHCRGFLRDRCSQLSGSMLESLIKIGLSVQII